MLVTPAVKPLSVYQPLSKFWIVAAFEALPPTTDRKTAQPSALAFRIRIDLISPFAIWRMRVKQRMLRVDDGPGSGLTLQLAPLGLEPFTTLLLRPAARFVSLNWASRACCC